MMEVLGQIVFVIYICCLGYIGIYCLFQFHLLYQYLTKVAISNKGELESQWEEHPFVTIQLPVFNEFFVLERLIDTVIKMDYPKSRFEIHILDDSTDETLQLSEKKAAEYRAKGFNIECISRIDRKGYKAGALKEAMLKAKGEFIVIFDADFMPERDFLKSTLPHFRDPRVGIVQTRWGHLNQKYSLLTELQAFQLNVHFTVEQKGRQRGQYLLQFNGTAGVWRTETIKDAGGWEADTLTEDLDLSYRAQLKGWRIVYLEDVLSPAELPAEIHGLKSQQFRWMKGGAETAKKLLPQVWASHLSVQQKVHATVHLLASSIFLSVFLLGFISVPLLFLLNPLGVEYSLMSLFLVSTIFVFIIYYVANVKVAWKGDNKLKSVSKFIFIFPIFLAISMGLSFHNSLAVIQGFLGRKSAFVRTPKFDIKTISDSFRKSKYSHRKISKVTITEGMLAIYFLVAMVFGLRMGNTSMFILHSLLFVGYSTIFYYSITHLRS